MVVADGNVITAGAAFAHIDLALSLVRSVSPDLAQHVAKFLLIDERPLQAAFVAYEHLNHQDPLAIDFERHVRAHLDEPFDVNRAAQAIGTSRRTLERRVRVPVRFAEQSGSSRACRPCGRSTVFGDLAQSPDHQSQHRVRRRHSIVTVWRDGVRATYPAKCLTRAGPVGAT